jgi:hypothetical protein
MLRTRSALLRFEMINGLSRAGTPKDCSDIGGKKPH